MLLNKIYHIAHIHKSLARFCTTQNLYQILGVAQRASFKDIRTNYLQKSKMLHPDQARDTSDAYHEIQKAYKTLINPEMRKKYDLSLGIRNSEWERELTSAAFSEKFQSKYYEELLSQDAIKIKVKHESLEQKLQAHFEQKIEAFRPQELFKSWTFLVSMVSLGALWLIWNSVEIFLINYTGSNQHKIKVSSTQRTLKAIPQFTR